MNGENEIFIVYNDASYQNIKKVLDPCVESINSTAIGFENFKIPSKSMPMTSWFAGQLSPGEKRSAIFTIENPSDSPIEIKIKSQKISLIKKNQYESSTKVRQLDANYLKDPELKNKNAFIPNYVQLSDVKLHKDV